jgi:hypothetical protein
MALLEIVNYTDFDLPVTIEDADGNAVSLVGKTVSMTIKEQSTDADSAAIFDVDQTVHADGINGSTTIPFRYAQTSTFPAGKFKWNLNIWSAGPLPEATIYGNIHIYQNLKTDFS